MQTFSEQELIKKIRDGETFTAKIDTQCFEMKISRYVPVICTAVHDGHQVHREFAEKMLVSEDERKYEEDPFTGDLIDSFPITIRALDSRYNYDLNRSPDDCIYQDAWGKKVWKEDLSDMERERILAFHNSYYRILRVLLTKIESMFSRCLLYDLHSYNYSRIEGEPPLFNIGTHYVDVKTYKPVVENLLELLNAIKIQGVDTRAVCDEVFFGKGYQAEFMNENHPKSLCIPLEVKKVFMEKQALECLPARFAELSKGMKQALEVNAAFFCRNNSSGTNNLLI